MPLSFEAQTSLVFSRNPVRFSYRITLTIGADALIRALRAAPPASVAEAGRIISVVWVVELCTVYVG